MDFLCIDKTKLESYSNLQWKILGYQYPLWRKDRKYGGRTIMVLRKGLITRRLRDSEGDTTEIICLKLTIYKKIWFIKFAYRPPNNNNI